MQPLIVKFEQSLRNSKSWLAKVFFGFILIFAYFLHSLHSLWHLLFSPPQKSFTMLYQQDNNGIWKKSYYNHLKYRHNVRFSSLSFTLLLITSIVAVQMILGLLSPFNKIEITYADTFDVTNTNNNGPGSLRNALLTASINPGADIINVTVSGTLNALSNLTVADDITIDASGVDFIVSGDINMHLTGDDIIINGLQFNDATILCTNHTGIDLNDLTMTGSDVNHAIEFNDGDNNSLDNITVSDYANGIYIHNANSFAITGGEFSSLTENGILIGNSQDITVSNISAHDNSTNGINVISSSNIITIEDSQIYNNTESGVTFANDCFGSTVDDNDLYNNDDYGVYLHDAENMEITNNNIYDNTDDGIYSDNSTGTQISNNTIYNNDAGISLFNGTNNNTLNDNSIYGNTAEGLVLQNAAGNVISSNFIGTNAGLADLGNSGIGIDLKTESTNDNTINGDNVIRYNSIGIRIIASTYNNTVENNDISYNNTEGVYIQDSATANTIGPDNDITNNNIGIHLDTSANTNTIIGNTINNNTDDGIKLESVEDNIINNNIIASNSYGISAFPDANGTLISENQIYSNSYVGITLFGNNCTLENNYIGTNPSFDDLGNGSNGMQISDGATGNVSQNDYIYYNGINGIYINQSDGNEISQDQIKYNQLHGISLRQSSSNTIRNSTITDNSGAGIGVLDGDYNQITRNVINNNTLGNISLSNGNEDLAAPTITSAVASANRLTVQGTTEENGKVEIFGSEDENASFNYLANLEINDGTFAIELDGDYASYAYLSATFTDADSNTSEFSSISLTADTAAPTSSASPAGGTYNSAQTITLTATDDRDTVPNIYYTTDGSAPTINDDLLYSAPFTLNEDTTLKFFAKDDVNNSEAVNTEEYTINLDDTNTNENTNEDFLSSFQIGNVRVDTNTEKVRTTDTTPAFKFSDVPESKIGSKIIIKIKQRQQDILTLTKKVNKFGRANITVPDEDALDLGNYKVYTGVVGEDNLAYRTKLQIIDFPPNLNLIPEVITDENLLIASTAEEVTASLWDNLGERATASSSSSTDGIFVINFASTPAAGYEYTLKVQASSNGVNSDEKTKTIFLTPNKYVETLVAIPNAEDNQYRLTYVNPKVSGLVPAGKTPVIYLDNVEQGSATIQEPCSVTCSWYYQLNNVSVGVHRIKVTIDDSSYIMIFRKDLSAITPKIVSHEDGASYNKPPLLTVIGHANDQLFIYNQDGNIIKEAAFNSLGVYKFNTTPYVEYGLNVFKFRAQDDAKFSSYAAFAFNLRRPLVTPAPSPAPEEPPVETNTNVNENTNQVINVNINENTNQVINTNSNLNVNVNKNSNINAPVLTTEEEQWLNVVTEEVMEKYNNDEKKELPGSLPYLTTEKEKLAETQKQQLTADLTDTIESSQQITARVNGERIAGEAQVDGSLIFKFTKEYDLSSLINRLLKLSGAIISDDSLIVEGQIPSTQLKNLPAYAFVVVYSDPVIKITQVDKDGRWTITIPLELLPAGQHTAYAQTEVNGVQSQQVELAKFAVEEKIKLSKTTWLVIINVAIAALLLLAAIIVQAIRNKKAKCAGGANEK